MPQPGEMESVYVFVCLWMCVCVCVVVPLLSCAASDKRTMAARTQNPQVRQPAWWSTSDFLWGESRTAPVLAVTLTQTSLPSFSRFYFFHPSGTHIFNLAIESKKGCFTIKKTTRLYRDALNFLSNKTSRKIGCLSSNISVCLCVCVTVMTHHPGIWQQGTSLSADLPGWECGLRKKWAERASGWTACRSASTEETQKTRLWTVSASCCSLESQRPFAFYYK